MTYKPGDNWCICDLSGKKVLMSETRKTWDGLRVHKDLWYPRNPQDFIRAIPDRMQVYDARPRPADVSQYPTYGCGPITLISPSGNVFTVVIKGSAITTEPAGYQDSAPAIIINGSELAVEDDGTLYTTASTDTGPFSWFVGTYLITTDSGGAIVFASDGQYFGSSYFAEGYF